MKHPIYIIVAADEQNGIGKNGHLPWHFKKEYKHFRETTCKTDDPTKQNMVIMGHRTWDSLQSKFKPLPNRRNVILTHHKDLDAPGAEICTSIDQAIDLADNEIEKIFIIGGGQIFKEFISDTRLAGIYMTKIHKIFDCDTFFPNIPAKFSKTKKIGSDEENGIKYDYLFFANSASIIFSK